MDRFFIAVADEQGNWDVLERIEKPSAVAATAYAERMHAGIDWYVLDANWNNVNAH
jgi:hypothetical protein